MKRAIKISSLLMALLVVSGQAMAAGLGKLSVSSVLGQPLRANIELLSVPQDGLSDISVKLADSDAYAQAHLDHPSWLYDLKLDVEKNADGKPVVRIASQTPVNDPFVDLLIELNWSSGRVMRDYTILLDPSPVKKPAEQAVMPAAVQAAATQTTPAAASKPGKTSGAAGKKAEPHTYGPVKSGETLHGIATKLLPADVSLDMMMASLYHTNPKAFYGNINLLKKGQVLNVPDRDTVMRLYSPHQATQLVRKQVEEWRAMRVHAADQAAQATTETAKGPSAEQGKITEAKPQAKPMPPSESKDVLTLSKGEPGKQGQASEAETTAKDLQLKEAQGRIKDLEKTVQDLQALLALKDQAATEAEKAKAATPPAPQAAPAPQQPAPAVKAKPPVPSPPPPKEEPGFMSMLLENPLYIGGAIGAALLAGLLWVVMVGRRRKASMSSFEQSVMTGGDPFKTSIFKMTTQPAQSVGGTSSQTGTHSEFSRLGLGSIETHAVDPIAEAEVYMAYGRDAQAEEILKEALHKEPGKHEFALKLLEIYAARKDKGNFETQASELYANLGDPASPTWRKAAEMGHALDPENPLYSMFTEQASTESEVAGDVADFAAEPAETEFASDLETMEPDVLAESPAEVPETEEQTVDLAGGLDFEPEPVAEESKAEFESKPEGLDFDMSQFESTEPEAEPESEPEPEGLDFDMSQFESTEPEPAEVEAKPADRANADEPIELDIAGWGEPEQAVAEPAVEEEQVGEPAESLGGLDFEPKFEVPEVEAPAEKEPEVGSIGSHADLTLPDLDFSNIDLDLEETTPPAPEEVKVDAGAEEIAVPESIDPDLLEEVNTKLDLAKAYMEMGDREGAREILDEVLKEGDAQQKQAAEAMMAEIG